MIKRGLSVSAEGLLKLNTYFFTRLDGSFRYKKVVKVSAFQIRIFIFVKK